jgi:hypothetical protein
MCSSTVWCAVGIGVKPNTINSAQTINSLQLRELVKNLPYIFSLVLIVVLPEQLLGIEAFSVVSHELRRLYF